MGYFPWLYMLNNQRVFIIIVYIICINVCIHVVEMVMEKHLLDLQWTDLSGIYYRPYHVCYP
jgi:hypothetical protein